MLTVLQNLAMSLKQKINGFGSFYMKNFCPKLVEVLRKGYDKDKFRRDTLAGMTVANLKKMAADMGIDTKALKTKDALIQAICAEEVYPGEPMDGPDLGAEAPVV